jgi:hypothetical protein
VGNACNVLVEKNETPRDEMPRFEKEANGIRKRYRTTRSSKKSKEDLDDPKWIEG